MAQCAHCNIDFIQRRSDHRFCSPEHRKLGERKPGAPPPPDHDQIARLFDASRQPDERVRVDDWHATPQYPEIVALDTFDTVRKRRRWYEELVGLGRL